MAPSSLTALGSVLGEEAPSSVGPGVRQTLRARGCGSGTRPAAVRCGGGEDRRQTPKQETDPPFANNHVQEHVSTNLF